MILLLTSLALLAHLGGSASSPFLLQIENGRVTSLRYRDPKFPINFLADRSALGDVKLTCRTAGGPWQAAPDSVAVRSWFEPKGVKLLWHIEVKNESPQPVEIGGLAVPLPMRTRFDKGPSSAVLKHSFISGAGSFAYWENDDPSSPRLLMTCLRGTSLEYWSRGAGGRYQAFVHSASEAPVIQANKGSWRWPHSSRLLPAGGSVKYGFAFEWAKDDSAIRDALAANGKLDVQVAPGMTVPSDLFTEVAFRSTDKVDRLIAEHPSQTEVRYLGARSGYRLYRIKFRRLGENLVTVHQLNGGKTYLEFFSCQPIETLIKKRTAFLTRSQQRKPDKWYDGLLSEWNMESHTLLSPDNYDRIKGWRIYEVTCDDPGLGKPAFLAAKNAEYPVQAEVDALDDYIQHFVCGGLQQTTDEPYPYGIYGIPDWKTLRESKQADPTKGVAHLWRCYDYPHIVSMYDSMYRVVFRNPAIRTRLSAREYLQRAFGTANAMFTIPLKLIQWSPYDTGYYNEVVIPGLIGDLRKEGLALDADRLQAFWERKVRTFVLGKVNLFGSEYAFDSTGFESTESIADYAVRNGPRLGISRPEAEKFLAEQMADNLFCRGVIEPAYYTLGSDYRGSGGDAYTLSYMAQMGGGSVLDYYLNYGKDASYLRLGYQSILSSWALMNAGAAKSDYGYWYPGVANDGAAGGGFEPSSFGVTWLGQPHGRGSWYYSCEIDLGFTGALRAARTVVADDPIFGRFCYGGTGAQHGSLYTFVPRDGVRRRVSIRTTRVTADMKLTGARFEAGKEIVLDEKRRLLKFWIAPTQTPDASLTVSHNHAKPLPPSPHPRQITLHL